jgi:tetracycline repressor-like protein
MASPRRSAAPPDDLALLVPEGGAPPVTLSAEVFGAALITFLGSRRLDMRALALELRIARATLYRRAGAREDILGEVIWYLTRRALIPAIRATSHLEGADRIAAMAGRFMRFVHGQPPLRRLLEEEPEAALRILTSKHGPVQGRLIEVTERLLRLEAERGHIVLTTDPHALAYVLVRIGESFLYADVIADNEPDLDQAEEILHRLLASPAGPARAARAASRRSRRR